MSTYGLHWYWLRFGAGYTEALDGYQRRERLAPETLEEEVSHRLATVLEKALRAPYYRDNWDARQARAAIQGDLSQLPLLEKEPLRTDPRAFLSTRIPRRQELTFHTSGSTGTPIATLWTRRELRDSLALRENRSATWAGVSYRDARATFSGRLVEPDPDAQDSCYRFNAVERQV